MIDSFEPDREAYQAQSTTCIDVRAYVEQKIAALAAHRSQYPIKPAMFPHSMLCEMLGHEYFVRIAPPIAFETELIASTTH